LEEIEAGTSDKMHDGKSGKTRASFARKGRKNEGGVGKSIKEKGGGGGPQRRKQPTDTRQAKKRYRGHNGGLIRFRGNKGVMIRKGKGVCLLKWKWPPPSRRFRPCHPREKTPAKPSNKQNEKNGKRRGGGKKREKKIQGEEKAGFVTTRN